MRTAPATASTGGSKSRRRDVPDVKRGRRRDVSDNGLTASYLTAKTGGGEGDIETVVHIGREPYGIATTLITSHRITPRRPIPDGDVIGT